MKRSMDLLGSIIGILILALPLMLLSALVRWKLGSPVFFSQERPGLDGIPFRMYKFRTMTDSRDADGRLLPDAQRMTPLGRALRVTSLDELPELWNVVKGDMSLVGPRPLLMEYLGFYTDEEKLRHSVRPGITGLAQINGRNTVTWNDRLAWDIRYVRAQTFTLDVKIIAITIWKVFRRDGVVVVPSTQFKKLSEERSK
ncbi:sugar transferase [Variovorax sp. J22R133]|uniref:sugar transferase n=1 Tax=Variovorax brevis TaxID=3053503 RepID=UPI0025765E7C|nr:sugar transferase [Variovorax sp. J22R133]MDM0110730.1 sugar transferase [Variovorax sp. J22R133]